MQGERDGSQRGPQGRGRGAFGKITAIQSDSIEIAGQDGTKTSFKLTSSTEFRKDRQSAKIGDFKVGDMVIVRTNPEAGNAAGATALMVAAAPQGFTGRGGGAGQGGAGFMQGTLGKDYVVGEVKSVDPPKLTVQRTDNVTQTLELNEETSLRRGRDSITMADIQAGDHILARGAVANDVFVPKSLERDPAGNVEAHAGNECGRRSARERRRRRQHHPLRSKSRRSSPIEQFFAWTASWWWR